MAGKYMPMATSRRRKARKEMMVSVGVAPGLEIFQSSQVRLSSDLPGSKTTDGHTG